MLTFTMFLCSRAVDEIRINVAIGSISVAGIGIRLARGVRTMSRSACRQVTTMQEGLYRQQSLRTILYAQFSEARGEVSLDRRLGNPEIACNLFVRATVRQRAHPLFV